MLDNKSLVSSANYLTDLNSMYSKNISIEKNNIHINGMQHTIEATIGVFDRVTNTDDIINILEATNISSNTDLIAQIQNIASAIDSIIADAIVTNTSGAIGSDIGLNISIQTDTTILKTLNIKVKYGSVVKYDIDSTSDNYIQILTTAGLIDINLINNINDVVGEVIPNIDEILLVDDKAAQVSADTLSVTEMKNEVTAIAISVDNNADISSAQASIATQKANEASISESNALSSKDSATASATSATASATSATAQATIATTKAGEASASATSAATSSSNAATSATSATASSTNATTKASEAATSATNAASSATASANSATSATTSATTATTKASEASVSATNAASSANSASTSANTATTKASEALTSANNSASSATASANSAAAAAISAANAAAVVGGNISLDSLNNVTVPTPATNDVLTFNSSVWVNTPSTGLGNNVLATSPTLVTPNIGVATGTSFNSITGLSSITPLANGTAAIGTSTTTARADHVHPLQTTITGNSGTATALQTGRTISITGDLIYTSPAFTGAANITAVGTLANSGVTAGTYNNNNTSVQSFTVDDKGRITAINGLTTITPNWSSITNKPNTVAGYNITDVYTASNTYSKSEVDSLVQGFRGKASATVATTTALTFNTAQTVIDGVAISITDRVLIKNQANAAQNGIYTNVTTTAWIRAENADTAEELTSALVFIDKGTANRDTAWLQTTDDIALGTSILNWIQFANSGSYSPLIHTHSAADITSGILPVVRGGTGVSTISGLVKGNGTSAMTAAIAGTDYVLPSGSITGNATTATRLQTIRTINGVPFDGSANITIVDSTKLPLSGGTMTGAITAIRETKVAMSANNIDLATGNLFTKTISGATTLTISNALADGNVNSFVLELTNGGSAVVTWFSGVKWAGGTAPTLTASGKDILGFYSHDGGTTWNILGVNKDVK